MGVVIHTNISIGKEKTLDDLKKEFAAIVVAIGCPGHATLNTKGEELEGVYHGLPFLRDVRVGLEPNVGKKVVVIGGGNVAVDAAQTALRVGAEQVTLVCLEAPDEVPAHELALAGALAEGVKMECSWGSVKFIANGNKVEEVEFQRCLNVFDACGQFSPVFDSCELNILKADTVIVAIGQSDDEEMLKRFNLSSEIISKIDPLTLQTSDERVFAAGDMATGPSSVIAAMANGRTAAESVHRYLAKEHMTYGRAYPGPIQTEFVIDTERGTAEPRTPIKTRPCSGKGDFKEIEKPFDAETARREAQRCYSCGQPFGKYRTCWFCLPCEVECPNDALYVEIPYLLR
jgi:NADPH-dependent glutamate synthase beta subunit-like oxidoreductase